MEPVPIISDDRTAVYGIIMTPDPNNEKHAIQTWRDIPDIRHVFIDLNSSHAFAAVIKECKAAIESGINPQCTSSGSSGSYLLRSKHGLALGIFKPRDEEPYADLNPRWTKWFHRHCSPCFFGRACLVPNGGWLGEAAASLVDRWLGVEMVPRTQVVQLMAPTFSYPAGVERTPKVGSFQLFVHNFKPFTDVAPIITMLCAQSKPFQLAFQRELERLVCLDHVIRNTDRTTDNWMVRVVWVGGDGEVVDKLVPDGDLTQLQPIVKIAAIDHGLSFPWRHPDGIRQYPYSWQDLPQSLIPFSDALRRQLLPILDDPKQWEQLCLQFAAIVTGNDPSTITFLPRLLSVLRGQLWTLRWSLQTPDSTPADLVAMARTRVEEDGEHFWKRYGWRKDKSGFREQHAMGRRWWVKEEPPYSCPCIPFCKQ